MIASIDLGGTRTKFGLIKEGQIIAADHCSSQTEGNIKNHLAEILLSLRHLCSKKAIRFSDCTGIGLVSTGIVDSFNMKVLSANEKYNDAVGFDFKGWALQETGLELRMENDARGALVGEWKYGAGRDCDNVVMVTLGTGVGTSAICDGRLLVGPNFTSGLLGGHIIIRSAGRRCTCGSIGCLESQASGWALEEIVRNHPRYFVSPLSRVEKQNFRDLFYYARASDRTAKDIWERFLTLWGEAIVTYIHLFDPEKVIIGGGLMNEPDPILDSFRATVKNLAWVKEGQVEIVAAHHPNNAGLIGAAALFENSGFGAQN